MLNPPAPPPLPAKDQHLVDALAGLIDAARRDVAQTVNSTLTLLYWQVGQRIRSEVLLEARAEYGQQILATLSQQLVPLYGQGFAAKSLARMVQFAEVFADAEIVATLSRQLSWSHFRELLPLKQPLERDFYAEMCRIERWSVRTLRERIGSQLYLRSALASGIRVAEYLAHIPDAQLLQRQLHRAVEHARERVAQAALASPPLTGGDGPT